MDFTLPESALAVQEGIRALAAKRDLAYWQRCDDEHRFPEEVWDDLASGGWLGLGVPTEYGGAGQGLLETAIALEALSAGGGGGGAAYLYVLTPGFGAMTLVRHGSLEQKAELLPGIAAGDLEFCFALTEPDAGSDSFAITTSARREGDDFVIRGQKIWTSGVERADWMIVVTRTSPASAGADKRHGFTLFLVDVPEAMAAGTLSATPIPKLGVNMVHSNVVHLDDVRVPAHRVLGEVDAGFAVLWDVLNPERILTAAGSVGHAELALRVASDYARERTVFGRAIGSNQAIAFPLAQIKAHIDLARLGMYKAAWLFDQGLPCGSEANAAKLVAAQAAWQATDQAFQTYGGMAYSTEYPVARLFRDARIQRVAPVSEELILAHIAQSELGLPRTY